MCKRGKAKNTQSLEIKDYLTRKQEEEEEERKQARLHHHLLEWYTNSGFLQHELLRKQALQLMQPWLLQNVSN